jgi:hypothetical protein
MNNIYYGYLGNICFASCGRNSVQALLDRFAPSDNRKIFLSMACIEHLDDI